MTRMECRQQMNFAEYQVRRGGLDPVWASRVIDMAEAAYMSEACEDRVAMRLSAAISYLETVVS